MRTALQVTRRLEVGPVVRRRLETLTHHALSHACLRLPQGLHVDVEGSDPVSRAPQMCAFANALQSGASTYAAYIYGSVALDLWAVEGVRFILFDSLKVGTTHSLHSPTSLPPISPSHLSLIPLPHVVVRWAATARAWRRTCGTAPPSRRCSSSAPASFPSCSFCWATGTPLGTRGRCFGARRATRCQRCVILSFLRPRLLSAPAGTASITKLLRPACTRRGCGTSVSAAPRRRQTPCP